jgi:sugar lactone lactonase YvrE
MTDLTKLTAAAALVTATMATTAMASEECAATDDARFFCGVANVEDLVLLPGGTKVIGSDLTGRGKQGYFWLFDTAGTVRPIQPDEITIGSGDGATDCPGAPDWSVFEPHGMSFEPQGDGGRLITTNHGGRESLEFFQVDMQDGEPKLTWTGCVPAAEGTWPDDLAVMPDGKLVVTSLWDPRDDKRFEKLIGGAPVGGLLTWTADDGWENVPVAEALSGPNGVVALPDGSGVYITAWSGFQLVHVEMGETPKFNTIDVGYAVDNLNWSNDGKTILMGGITDTVEVAFGCFISEEPNCPGMGTRIDRFDPATGEITEVVPAGVYGQFGAATGGVEVGDEIWVGSFHADRIGVFAK